MFPWSPDFPPSYAASCFGGRPSGHLTQVEDREMGSEKREGIPPPEAPRCATALRPPRIGQGYRIWDFEHLGAAGREIFESEPASNGNFRIRRSRTAQQRNRTFGQLLASSIRFFICDSPAALGEVGLLRSHRPTDLRNASYCCSASSAARMCLHSSSAMPSIFKGRKWRWKAPMTTSGATSMSGRIP